MNKQFVEIKGVFMEYIEQEIPCSVIGYKKWIDNYGYEWITDLNNSFVAESELEIRGAK
jgi:hypothetical protein